MDLLTLYWVLILPSVGAFLGGVAGITVVLWAAITLSSFISAYTDSEEKKVMSNAKRSAPKILIPSAIILLLSVFIPSSKQMMYLIGGYAVTNAENIEKLPKNVVNAANKFLEDYTDQKAEK